MPISANRTLLVTTMALISCKLAGAFVGAPARLVRRGALSAAAPQRRLLSTSHTSQSSGTSGGVAGVTLRRSAAAAAAATAVAGMSAGGAAEADAGERTHSLADQTARFERAKKEGNARCVRPRASIRVAPPVGARPRPHASLPSMRRAGAPPRSDRVRVRRLASWCGASDRRAPIFR